MSDKFALFGAVAASLGPGELFLKEEGYVLCRDGICAGAADTLPPEFDGCDVLDYSGRIIIPGMTDLAAGGAAYDVRGITSALLPEEKAAFLAEEEAAWPDDLYAERALDLFAEDLYEGAVTRVVVPGSQSGDITAVMMAILEEAGLVSLVGHKVTDREESRDLFGAVMDFDHTFPAVTTVSDAENRLNGGFDREAADLLAAALSLKRVAPYDRDLMADDTYDGSVLLLSEGHFPASEDEYRSVREREAVLAVCPSASLDGGLPIPPVRAYLDAGLHCGIGSLVGFGSTASPFRTMTAVQQLSNIRAMMTKDPRQRLSFENVFYMATLGGGRAFGRVGTFEEGCEFDAVVLDDTALETMRPLSLRERLERVISCGDDRQIVGKFIRGNQIF